MKRISALHNSKGIWLALMGLCLFGLASCDKDEVEEAGLTGNGRPLTVRLSISAGSLQDLNATRAGDDANAAEHEFMNTLYVYIVDAESNQLEYIIKNPLADNAEAATGNATTGDCYEYTQDIELTPGNKTIYAFSNIDQYTDGEKTGIDLLKDCFGETAGFTVSTDALQSFCVDDPAGKIKFDNGMFLPMSAQATVEVDASTSEISIELVRLVSKVNITLPTDGIPTGEDSQLTFSGYADRVPLLEGGTADGISREEEQTFSLKKDYDGQTISFYVNATPKDEPFKVSLTANSNTATVTSCESQTERTDLPRNSIYPLKLTFEDVEPEFSIRGFAPPIGASFLETEYVLTPPDKNLSVDVAEGTYLWLSVIKNPGSNIISAEWDIPDQQYGFGIYDGFPPLVELPTTIPADEMVEIPSQQISSPMPYYYKAYVTITWETTEGTRIVRTYTISINVTKEIWDIDYISLLGL